MSLDAPENAAPVPPLPVVVFDIETTGLSPVSCRIVSIAASCGGREFSALVNPRCPIPHAAARVHGITDARVRGEPDWRAVGARFWRWVERQAGAARGVVLVGHNARRFDLPFVLAESARAGLPPPALRRLLLVDTLRVCRDVFRMLRSHRQVAVYEHLFGAPPPGAHDALCDVRALCRVVEHAAVRRSLARFAEDAMPARWRALLAPPPANGPPPQQARTPAAEPARGGAPMPERVECARESVDEQPRGGAPPAETPAARPQPEAAGAVAAPALEPARPVPPPPRAASAFVCAMCRRVASRHFAHSCVAKS